MFFVREFEFFESEGYVLAFPCDMGGGTEGVDMDDALRMAADWLSLKAEDALARGRELEGGAFGHEPQNGGKVIALAVDVDLERVPAVTAAEASKRLGVSTARVAQLCREGRLFSWKSGGTRMVALDSLELRLAERPKAGRPRRNAVTA